MDVVKRTRDFDQNKARILIDLQGGEGGGGKDRSKKGSLDAPIVDLVGMINAHKDYVTTSSCSGRIALFEDVDGVVCHKSGGKWLLSSHSQVTTQAVRAALKSCKARGQEGGSVTLKQEPLVLHIECRDMFSAERLLKVGVGSGFRESGISLGKKRALVAIRTGANSLEMPLVLDGINVTTDAGLEALILLANRKFNLNVKRTERFANAFVAACRSDNSPARPLSPSSSRPLQLAQSTSLERGEGAGQEAEDSLRSLRWVKAEATPESQALCRWGHSLSRAGKDVYWMFGGWCSQPAGRRNDLIELKVSGTRLCVRPLAPHAACPAPRQREKHAALVLPASHSSDTPVLLIFGGRASPSQALGDLWAFDGKKGWRELSPSGPPPRARWSHSITLLRGGRLLVYGGRDRNMVFGGVLHFLSRSEDGLWSWSEERQEPSSFGPEALPPLFAHTTSDVSCSDKGTKLLLWGGLRDLSGRVFQRGGILVDLAVRACSPLLAGEPGRYAHSATALGTSLVITGGVLADEARCGVALVLEMGKDHRFAKVIRIASPFPRLQAPPLVHHATAPVGRRGTQCDSQGALLVIGGGVQTFAFSPVFAPPLMLLPPSWPAFAAGLVKTGGAEPAPVAENTASKASKRTPLPQPPPCLCLLTNTASAKLLKTALERGGLFDKRRRIGRSTSVPGRVAIPILSNDTNASLLEELKALCSPTPIAAPTSECISQPVRLFLEALRGRRPSEVVQGWCEEDAPYGALALNSQRLCLQAALRDALEVSGLSPSLVTERLLTSLHVERLGDVLLLERDHPFQEASLWAPAYPALWPALLSVFPGATRVARMAPIQPGTKRRSQVALLYPPPTPEDEDLPPGPGGPGWVTVRENGLRYSLDITKNMFSSGNVSEKARIARMDCSGQTVVDLYAGIGYYTLPLAVHGRASRVTACEWNLDALYALRHNLRSNGVEGVVEVLEGDNRLSTRSLPDRVAHRVHLGLIPSSEEGWPIAARLLRAEGGMLHVHGNMLESVAAAWVARVEDFFRGQGRELGRPWADRVECVHLERVKSYAPSVWHFVADVQCGGSVLTNGQGVGVTS